MEPAFSRVEFGIVSRSRPQRADAGSAVAAAAYNLCGRLADGGRQFDFRRKAGEHAAHNVLLPAGAPPEMRDPGNLWRAAEAAERRADAQTARQVLVSIPRELPTADRLAFAEAIAAPWVADGAAVQIDIHNPRAADGASSRTRISL
ncbi:MobA/MobL family protein [Pseudoroseomonas wenyumeiae]